MNQKNYFFLICCLGMANVLFAMESCGELSYFASACQQIENAFQKNDITLLVVPLDFFSDLQACSIEPVQEAIDNFVYPKEMEKFPSPLLYSIKKIASINAQIANLISIQQQQVNALPALNEVTEYNDLLKQKNEHFQVLKMLCISFPIFFSNKWNCERTTPLLYACSCTDEMPTEVELLLVNNADPSQEITGEDVRHKTAFEAANSFGHMLSIQQLIKYDKRNFCGTNNKDIDVQEEGVTRGFASRTDGFFTMGLRKKQLIKKHEKLVSTIKNSNYKEFQKRISQDYIDINYMHHDQAYGPLCLLAIALNNYFSQRELFFKIIPEAVSEPSKFLQNRVADGHNAAQGILFDIIEKKARLDTEYTFNPTVEDIRNQHFSTPFKEAIKYNARSLIIKLFENGVNINYKGDLDELAPTPLELASGISEDLLKFIFTLINK